MPLAVALALALVGRLGDGGGRAFLTGAAIGGGFLAGYIVTFGPPPLVPRTALQKIAAVAALGLGLGLVFDLLRIGPSARRAAIVIVGAAASIWLAWPVLRPVVSFDLLRAGLAVALALFAAWRGGAAQGDVLGAAVMLIAVGVGLALLSVPGAAVSIGQMAAALGAAAGGLVLLNWPARRDPFGATALFTGYGLAASLLAQAALFTRINVAALVIASLAFFADGVVRRLFPRLAHGSFWFAIAVGVAAAMPVALAVALATFWPAAGGNGSSPYWR